MANQKKDNHNKDINQIAERLYSVEKQIKNIIEDKNKTITSNYETEAIKQHKRLNRLTFAIVFIAGIQFLVYLGLLYQTIKQTPAIINAAKLANQNFESTQRAFLKIGDPIEVYAFRELQMPIENYGNTPCNYIFIDIKCRVSRINETLNWRMPLAHIDSNCISIYPKQIKRVCFFLPRFSKSEIDSIKNNLISIYIVGNIVYDTGFNNKDELDIDIIYNCITKKWEPISILSVIDLNEEHKYEHTQTNK